MLDAGLTQFIRKHWGRRTPLWIADRYGVTVREVMDHASHLQGLVWHSPGICEAEAEERRGRALVEGPELDSEMARRMAEADATPDDEADFSELIYARAAAIRGVTKTPTHRAASDGLCSKHGETP